MSPESIGLRDLLQVMREETAQRLARIEGKLDTKAENARLEVLEERFRRLEAGCAMRLDLEDLEARVISRDSIGRMIGEALQDASSRGWTQRERWLAVGGFLILVLNLVVGLVALGPDLFGKPG